MNTNCLSHIALIKAFLPLLKRTAKEGRGYGRIVNISSLAGLMGVSVRTCYSASKFGIGGFSRSLRTEVKQYGIKVQMMYPGYVQTNVSKNAQIGKPGESFGKTDDNCKNGMQVEQAAREMLVASYMGKNEFICTSKAFHRLVVPLREVWSWFEDFASSTDFKSQMGAIHRAA